MHLLKGRQQAWVRRLQAAVVGLILGCIIYAVYKLWNQIVALRPVVQPGWLLLSVGIVSLTILGWALVWSWLMGRFSGGQGLFTQTVSAYMYGNAAKYVPGAVWNFFARAYLGGRAGLNTRKVWTATLFEFASLILTGLILYTVSLLFPHRHPALLPWPVLALGIAALLALLSPPALRAIDARLQRGKPPQSPSQTIGWNTYALYLLLSLVNWSAVGLAFYLFVRSLYPAPPELAPELVGIWSLAVAAGMLAVGIPQGIGVKEGILLVGLTAFFSLPQALAISVLSRAWIIGSDLLALALWWGIDQLFLRRKLRTPAEPAIHEQ